MTTKKSAAGFTLIEIMIVIAIIGIIAAFAYASYTNMIMRSNRSEAKAELMDISQRLQRCYTTLNSYNNKDDCAVRADLEDGIVTATDLYEITLAATATTFTLTATADRAPQTNDTDCLTMTLNHTGARTPADCW